MGVLLGVVSTMGVDVRVLGLGCVSLIISGLLIYSIVGEDLGDPIRVLNNQYPPTYREGEEAVYGLSLLVRNRDDDIRVEFCVLIPKRLESVEMVDPNLLFNESSEPADVLGNSKKFLWFSDQADSLGIKPEIYAKEVEIDGQRFELLVHDFGVLLYLLGHDSVTNQPLVYGAAINGTGEAIYLEGFRDFFYKPESNIRLVDLTHGDNETRYVPDDQLLEGSEDVSLSQAPRGSVGFVSGQRDDVVKVSFSVKVFSLPPGSYSRGVAFIQIIKVHLNGRLFDQPIINVVGQG